MDEQQPGSSSKSFKETKEVLQADEPAEWKLNNWTSLEDQSHAHRKLDHTQAKLCRKNGCRFLESPTDTAWDLSSGSRSERPEWGKKWHRPPSTKSLMRCRCFFGWEVNTSWSSNRSWGSGSLCTRLPTSKSPRSVYFPTTIWATSLPGTGKKTGTNNE